MKKSMIWFFYFAVMGIIWGWTHTSTIGMIMAFINWVLAVYCLYLWLRPKKQLVCD